MTALTGKTVLVTGATGNIGGRLVERLVAEHGAKTRTLVRQFEKGARIARFDVEMVKGSLEDAQAIDAAVAGADVVFNLAWDFSDSIENNLACIRNVYEACLRHGVSRLVHISSIAVYEPFEDGELAEAMQPVPKGFPYGDAKIAVERELLCMVEEKNLPAVILEPTNVYGPFAGFWTDGVVQQLLGGGLILPEDAKGLCNVVYIDDLVDAMVLAATKPEAIGERFIISGGEPVPWRRFYQAYEDCLEIKSVQTMPFEDISRQKKSVLANLKLLLANPRRITKWGPAAALLQPLKRWLGDKAKARLRGLYAGYRSTLAPKATEMPEQYLLDLYTANTRCRIDKARSGLGYNPRFDFEAGMRLTGDYVRWAYPPDTHPRHP